MPKIKSLLFKQAPRRDQKLETQHSSAEADNALLTLTPRHEIRRPAQSALIAQPQSSGHAALFAVDDNGPVSVDSLAKFLDRASQWSPDAGVLDKQSKKGVVTRAATEGLRES